MPSVLRLNSDIVRRTEHFAFCAKCRNYIPGDSALTLNNLDQRQIHDAPLYGLMTTASPKSSWPIVALVLCCPMM
jgi:hypothetical protein